MTWLLALLGVILIGLSAWSGPWLTKRPRHTGGGEPEVPASRDEAWAILGQPIHRAEEMARHSEQQSRRYQQGLLMGLGIGLVAAWAVTLVTPRTAPVPPVVAQAPAPVGPGGSAAPGATAPPAANPATSGGETGTGPTGQTAPAPPRQAADVKFTVDEGDSAPTIAGKLKAAGLIADESAFLARVADRGVDTMLRAGTFVIPTQASVDQVIDALAG